MQFLKDQIRPIYRLARRTIGARLVRRDQTAVLTESASPCVIGLLSSTSGLGQSARLCIDALARDYSNLYVDDVAAYFNNADGEPFRHSSMGQEPPADMVGIIHLNPPMMIPFMLSARGAKYRRAFIIGYWAWELETLPMEWMRASRAIHAVFVPSHFVKQAIEKHTETPVSVVAHPVKTPVGQTDIRASRGIAQNDVVFTCIFNFGSSFNRKNPAATIRAFKAAFPATTNAKLVMKTTFGGKHKQDLEALQRETAGTPNIIIIDEIWTEQQISDLILSSDVMMSLHRSEGFALTIAEAMAAGKPVVATGWSGNMDFCNPDCAAVVAYKLVPLVDRHPDYAQVRDGRWAEADTADAARYLSALHQSKELRHKLGEAGRMNLRRVIQRNSYREAIAALR